MSHPYAMRAAGGWSLLISARIKLRLNVPKVGSPLINLHVVGRTSAFTVESTMIPALHTGPAHDKQQASVGQASRHVCVTLQFGSSRTVSDLHNGVVCRVMVKAGS